jgi:hypothetical protein
MSNYPRDLINETEETVADDLILKIATEKDNDADQTTEWEVSTEGEF